MRTPGRRRPQSFQKPDPQTRTVPNSTQDLRTEPESTTIKSGTPQPRTQSQARAFVGKASFYAYTRGKTYIETEWGRGYVLREPHVDERIPA